MGLLKKNDYLIVPLLWAATVFSIAHLFGVTYSSDSYAYYLIGKNIVSGNGYWSPTIRENVLGASFNSRVFPPLFPILCGITDALFRKAIASGVIVNLVVIYGIFHAVYCIGKKAGGRLFCLVPLACYFFIMADVPFIYEITTGCSIPLATLILLIILYLSAAKAPLAPVSCMVLGILDGLLYLTRFDASPFCMVFPLALCWIRNEKFRNAFFIYLGLGVTLSPWWISNLLAFGKPFAANQSMMVFSIYTGNPILAFFKNGIPMGFSDPALWLKQRLLCTGRNIWFIYNLLFPLDWLPSFGEASVSLGLVMMPVYFGFVSVLGGAAILALAAAGFIRSAGNRPAYIFIRMSLVWVIVNIVTVSLTQLVEMRYFSASILLLILQGTAGIAMLLEKKGGVEKLPSSRAMLFPATLSAAVFIAVLYMVYPQLQRDDFGARYVKLYADFKPFIEKGALVGCNIHADNIAYYSGWKTIYVPYNTFTPDENFIAWKQHFNVRYIIVDSRFGFQDSAQIKRIATSGSWQLVDIKGL